MKPGELRDRLERYIAVRRAVGFPMRADARLLLGFVRFVEQQGFDGALRSRLTFEWVERYTGHGPAAQARRLTVVRGFLSHVRASVPETEVPPPGIFAGLRRPVPYIFSADEISALVESAHQLGPVGSLRPHTCATVIGLLAASGMRIGEVVKLRLEDVRLDIDPPYVRVLGGKFRKSRLVPLHPSTAAALRRYASQKLRLGYHEVCDSFFVSERMDSISDRAVRRPFGRLTRQLCLTAGPRRPRLHDLRHTFAVRRMLAWYREGADVRARLPELSVYLGHLRPEDTFWYLSAVPELLGLAAERFERFERFAGEAGTP